MPLISAPTDAYRHAPAANEIEVTVIGPGFGEAALVHIGDGKWLLIDSCVDKGAPEPASLRYLADIGIDPAAVFLIVISHWDDDHCRGLADLARTCHSAEISMSKAFIEKDFTAYVATYRSPLTQRARSGVREIRELLEVLRTSNRTQILNATVDRRLFAPGVHALTHGTDVSAWTLTPSDEEYDIFLAWLASKMPVVGETRRVAPKRLRNDLSVAVYLSVGDDAVLFGGDLEEEGNPLTGWNAVLASKGRPTGPASLFKVSHHGSATGDHAHVWRDMLTDDPVAIIAPFRNGRVSLPTNADVNRTLEYTDKAFASTSLRSLAPQPMDRTVQKTIQDVTRSFTTLKPEMGLVRARKKAGSNDQWQIELFGGATELRRIR